MIDPEPPILLNVSATPLLVAASCTTLVPTPPKTTPSAANPAVQPASSPRCSRQARPSGEERPALAWAGPSREASRPAPRSRRVSRTPATATVTTVASSAMIAGVQSSAPYGMIF